MQIFDPISDYPDAGSVGGGGDEDEGSQHSMSAGDSEISSMASGRASTTVLKFESASIDINDTMKK